MPRPPLQFIFDFDGTLTKKDTLHVVADAGYKRHDAEGKLEQLPTWNSIVDAYMSDYQAYASNYSPIKEKRTTFSSEIAWLDSLADVERASADRVIAARIFDKVTKQDVEEAAAHALKIGSVELRPGWAELLVLIHDLNTRTSSTTSRSNILQLVSVNWSRWFIWSVMWKAALAIEDQTLFDRVKDVLLDVAVYANEIPSIMSHSESSIASMSEPKGQAMTLRTAGDKLKHLQSKTVTPDIRETPLRVYVGDSTTDLGCLVMADVGICIRDGSMSSGQQDLASTCERLGISVKSLDEYKDNQAASSALDRVEKPTMNEKIVLYYAQDFHEIARWTAK